MKRVRSVKVEVDTSKCSKPMECQKCMRICPEAVFAALPLNPKRYKLAKDFVLFAPFQAACIVCDLCISVCPANAIKITAPGGQ